MIFGENLYVNEYGKLIQPDYVYNSLLLIDGVQMEYEWLDIIFDNLYWLSEFEYIVGEDFMRDFKTRLL